MSDWDLSGFSPLQFVIPPGITNAVLVTDPGFCLGNVVKYNTGGSLMVMPAPGITNNTNGYGATYSSDQLLAGYSAGRFYLMDTAPMAYNGAARYYLAALGATATGQMLRALGAAYPERATYGISVV